MILALTGWSCKQARAKEGSTGDTIHYLECISCFYKTKIENIKQTAAPPCILLEFDPLNSHLDHCYFSHNVANPRKANKKSTAKVRRENGTKILISMLYKRYAALTANNSAVNAPLPQDKHRAT